MRVKPPVQPLVFCYGEAASLCGAVARLYTVFPHMPARLCLYRGRYYLSVFANLRERGRVSLCAGEYGEYKGPAPVLYSFYAEHGKEISKNAVEELGAALAGENNGKGP